MAMAGESATDDFYLFHRLWFRVWQWPAMILMRLVAMPPPPP
jgi:hypothetical protein